MYNKACFLRGGEKGIEENTNNFEISKFKTLQRGIF